MAAALVVAAIAACSSCGGSRIAGGTSTSQGAGPTTTTATPTGSSLDATPSTTSTPSTTAPRGAGAVPPPPVASSGASVGWTVGPWQPAGRPANGGPAVFTSILQPTRGGPAVGAARLDTSRLRVVLYAGTSDPGGSWSAQGAVPNSLQPALVATFNSGFKFNQSRGGFYADGRAGVALRNGAASLVVYGDGSATVGEWGRDATLTANVVAVRQNLELLVDAGRPAPNVATNIQPTWGFMLNGAVVNWRSAVGVDASGRLVYVGGPGLDPTSLAGALIAAGAVRAMELDVNPAWVSFNTFTDGAGAVVGTKLLPGMNAAANRFLYPGPRDFIAVFTR